MDATGRKHFFSACRNWICNSITVINPADLKEKLKIEVDGQKADYTLITMSHG